MPIRCAAAAPSTATGSFSVAAFRKVPWATVVPTAAGRPRLVASTVSALVSTEGISGLRKALLLPTVPMSWTLVTPCMRLIIPGEVLGNWAVPPVSDWPVCTVSRLVPSAEISASKPACDEDDSPSTATIAATPIAMPKADRPARSFLVRNPTAARRARSPGCNRAAEGVTVVMTAPADRPGRAVPRRPAGRRPARPGPARPGPARRAGRRCR